MVKNFVLDLILKNETQESLFNSSKTRLALYLPSLDNLSRLIMHTKA